jgi:DNA-binding IclR family transcriptional regulator
MEPIASGSLERLCRATITDGDALRADPAEVRARGWAISFEETNVGVWGVAVPVLDEERRAVAAVGLAGPSARLSQNEVLGHLERLRDAALATGAPLGLEVPELAWP